MQRAAVRLLLVTTRTHRVFVQKLLCRALMRRVQTQSQAEIAHMLRAATIQLLERIAMLRAYKL